MLIGRRFACAPVCVVYECETATFLGQFSFTRVYLIFYNPLAFALCRANKDPRNIIVASRTVLNSIS